MAVPSTFADLNTTPASNSGLIDNSTAVGAYDDHCRSIYALIASIYANSGNGWASPYLTSANPSYTGTFSGGTGVFNLGSGQFYKDASGNVGYGTTTPQRQIHAQGTASVVGAYQMVLEGAFSGYGAGVSFQSRTSSGGVRVEMARITADGEAAWDTNAANQDAGLRFSTTRDGTLALRVRIDSGGNLLIENTALAPITPSGGALYVEGGALKYRGSGGTVTTLAPA